MIAMMFGVLHMNIGIGALCHPPNIIIMWVNISNAILMNSRERVHSDPLLKLAGPRFNTLKRERNVYSILEKST